MKNNNFTGYKPIHIVHLFYANLKEGLRKKAYLLEDVGIHLKKNQEEYLRNIYFNLH